MTLLLNKKDAPKVCDYVAKVINAKLLHFLLFLLSSGALDSIKYVASTQEKFFVSYN